MKRLRAFLVSLPLVALLFSVLPLPAAAAPAAPLTVVAACESNVASNLFGFSPWYACLKAKNGEVALRSLTDIWLIVFPVVESIVKVAALVSAGYIFYMLILMITARGNSSKIATALNGIRDAVIGFIICLISVAIVNFVSTQFTT